MSPPVPARIVAFRVNNQDRFGVVPDAGSQLPPAELGVWRGTAIGGYEGFWEK
jgi:hypothetical protein